MTSAVSHATIVPGPAPATKESGESVLASAGNGARSVSQGAAAGRFADLEAAIRALPGSDNPTIRALRNVAEAAFAFEAWWRDRYQVEKPNCPYLQRLFTALAALVPNARAAAGKSDHWVVGGEYADTMFNALAPRASLEVYGPFEDYGSARDEWKYRTMLTIDDAHRRYRIVTEDPSKIAA